MCSRPKILLLLTLLLLLMCGSGSVQVVRAQGAAGSTAAPRVWFDAVQWLRLDEPLLLHFTGAAPLDITVQETTPNAARWWDITHLQTEAGQTSIALQVTPVSEYSFTLRARAVAVGGESSGWVQSQPINQYRTLMQIYLADQRGHPLPLQDIGLSGQRWYYEQPWFWQDEDSQSIFAYTINPKWTLASPQIPGYGAWNDLRIAGYQHETITSPAQTISTLYLPPQDNRLRTTATTDLPLWEVEGQGRLLILQQNNLTPSNHQFLPNGENTAYICPLWDFISTDVGNLNQPTLSFYYQTNISRLAVVWQTQEDHQFLDRQALPATTACCRNWRYVWRDMSPIRDTPGRPCFEFTAGSTHNAFLLFDNVALGSTRSELSLHRIPAPLPPRTGQDYALQFAIGNHSSYTATGRIQISAASLVTPQTRLLPVLAPGETTTATFVLTMPVTSTLVPYEAVVGNPEMDETPADNTLRDTLIPDPQQLYLPLHLLAAHPSSLRDEP